MMNRTFRKIVALVVAATTLFSTIEVAHAGLTQSLDAMINVTAPTNVQTRDRGGLVGGTVSVRFPVRNVSLFYFDPPRLSAGCGGIDMYMGSFSFINADAFKGMLKGIAQAAAGYFFKLALNAICPPCEAILSSLQDLSTILNNNALSTCKIARDVMSGDAFTKLKKTLEGSSEDAGKWVDPAGQPVAAGALDGWFSGFMDIFTGARNNQKKTAKYTPNSGNAVWKALALSKSSEIFDTNGGGPLGEVEFANTIISLIGTVIIAPQDEVAGGAPSAVPAMDAACIANADACGPGGNIYRPRLTFNNILEGSDNGTAKMWRCKMSKGGMNEFDMSNPYGCLDMVEEDFTFIGTRKFINKWLFCSPATGIPAGVAPSTACWLGGNAETDSIVGRMSSGVALDPNQIQFLNNFRQPIVRLLMEVQRSREASEQIAHAFAPYMALEMAFTMGTKMAEIADKAFSKTTEVAMPEDTKKAVDEFKTYVALARDKETAYGKQVVEAVELANAARTMDPVIIAAAFKR